MGETQSRNSVEENPPVYIQEDVLNRLERQVTMEQQKKSEDPRKYCMKNPAAKVYLLDSESTKEDELAKNKTYWKKRVDDARELQDNIKKVIEAERDQGFKDVQATLTSSTAEEKENPCKDNLGAVSNCYKSNSKEPLVCDGDVKKFITCVKTAKMEALTSKKEEDVK